MSDFEDRALTIDDETEGGDPPCWAHLFEEGVDPDVRVRCVYDPPTSDDGRRILVDCIWPRGISQVEAAIDLWAKDVAPSTDLRRWFGHDPARWQEFTRRYRQELKTRPESWRSLLEAAATGPLTLVSSARDEECNQAAVLRQYLEERLTTY